jgi:protein SCO1/2
MCQRRRLTIDLAKVALLAAALCGAPLHTHAAPGAMPMTMPGMTTMPAARPMPSMSIYNITSPWTVQSGTRVQLSTLRGQIVVAAMVYTHCKDVCPLTAERMKEIEHALPKQIQGKVRYVLFSMDWARDTPEQLKLFASQHRLDLAHWTLFHGDEGAVRELAAALGVSLYRQPSGDFQHSIAIFLLDRDGVVIAQDDDLQGPSQPMIVKITDALRKPAP